MITFPKWETDWQGRTFKDSRNVEFIAIGYGDNGSNGGQYIIGVRGDATSVTMRTTLLKEATFDPAKPAVPVP